MANGFNPFTSQQSLLDFITQQGSNGETPLDPAMELGRADDVIDPITGMSMQGFLDQQRASGVVPEFTDRASRSTDPAKAIDQFTIESRKAKILETFKANIPADYYDFSTATNPREAADRIAALNNFIRQEGMNAEREKAEELGLYQLQENYNKLRAIPGATGFDSVRERLANMEEQIKAKEAQLDKYIGQDRDGNVVGDLGPAFSDMKELQDKWRNRLVELEKEDQDRRKGSGPASIQEKFNTKLSIELGGQPGIEQLSKLVGDTPDNVLRKAGANQISPEVLALHQAENQRGRAVDFAEAFTGFGPEAARAMIRRGLGENEGFALEEKHLNEMVDEASNESLIKGTMDAMTEEYRKQRGIPATEQLKKDDLANLRAQAKDQVFLGVWQKYKTGMKERHVQPQAYSLRFDSGASEQEKLGAEFLTSLFPKAFTYNPNPDVTLQELEKAKEAYAERVKLNPEYVPPFEEVYQRMNRSMINEVNMLVSPLGMPIVSPNDPEIRHIQMNLLLSDLQKTQRGILGTPAAAQVFSFIKHFTPGAGDL